jgi:hypothetical protein
VYTLADILTVFFRAMQPVLLNPALEGVIIHLEITSLYSLKFIVEHSKLQPYLYGRQAQLFLKGSLSQWIEFCYYKGTHSSIEVTGDVALLQLLHDDCQRLVDKIHDSILLNQPPLLRSLIETLKNSLKNLNINQQFFVTKIFFQEQEGFLFSLYYQLERLSQKVNIVFSEQKEKL